MLKRLHLLMYILFYPWNCYAISGAISEAVVLDGQDYARAVIPMITIDYSKEGFLDSNTQLGCGGIVLDVNHVMTALHCLDRADYQPNTENQYAFILNRIDVMLPSQLNPLMYDLDFSNIRFDHGASFYDMRESFLPNENKVDKYTVKKIYIPKPDNNKIIPDLAILELDKLTPYNPVLVRFSAVNNIDIANQNTYIYGWSFDTHDYDIDNPEPIGRLKKANLEGAKINNNEIIATNQPCAGDSGSPILLREGEAFRLLGIASYGGGEMIPSSTLCYQNVHAVSISNNVAWRNEVLSGKIKETCTIKQLCTVGRITNDEL